MKSFWIFSCTGKFSQIKCEIQLPRDNLGDRKVLERAFFRLLKSLKSQILESIVPPPGCTGFITNLPFWATWSLERMYSVKKVYFFYYCFCKIHKKMFRTASSFEPSCLWIRHQPLQTRWFNSRPCGLNSIQFLGSFHTCSVKSFSKFLKITQILGFLFLSEIPKKVLSCNFLNFIIIEIFKISKIKI